VLETIPLQPCQRSRYPVVMACSQIFVEVQGSRRCLTRRSVTAVQLPCPAVSLLLLRLVVVAVLVLEAMRRVGWLARWLVPWQRGRVKCRILVSAYPH
jgi:hypothetical protein